jgi:hypothetical protein
VLAKKHLVHFEHELVLEKKDVLHFEHAGVLAKKDLVHFEYELVLEMNDLVLAEYEAPRGRLPASQIRLLDPVDVGPDDPRDVGPLRHARERNDVLPRRAPGDVVRLRVLVDVDQVERNVPLTEPVLEDFARPAPGRAVHDDARIGRREEGGRALRRRAAVPESKSCENDDRRGEETHHPRA